jgi:hypothetical protein
VKKLIIFITLILTLFICVSISNPSDIDTDTHNFPPDTTQIDTSYIPVDTTGVLTNSFFIYMMLNNFVVDAVDNGLDSMEVVEHINRLDAVIIDDLSEEGLWGVTIYKTDTSTSAGIRGMIVLDEDVLKNYDFLKITFYHEMGHWFGLEHCKCRNSIMMKSDYKRGVENILKNWDKKVGHLMRKIDRRFNEEESHFDFPDMDDVDIDINIDQSVLR